MTAARAGHELVVHALGQDELHGEIQFSYEWCG